jgi:hypothetical protein
MAKVTAQQWLTKWGTNLNAASQYITNGVNNVQTAPGVSAAAAQDRMLQNLTQAVTSGRWAKAVSGVSLADWKSAMTTKAIPRIPQGVTSAQKSATQTITNLLSAVDTAAQAANAIPKGGLQQSIQRATAFMTAMAQAKGTIKAG